MAKGGENMKGNNMVVMIVVAIVIAGAAFFGGMQYEKTKAPARGAQFGNAQGGQGGGRFFRTGGANGAGGGATIGQIVSVDSTGITVKLPDGSSKIVIIPSGTKITKSDTATISDLTKGAQVAAFGTTNSDGSITAQTVQLNPQIRMRTGTGGQTNGG